GNSFITYTTDQGLANNVVLSIAEDKSGNLWFGTAQGLSILTLSDMPEGGVGVGERTSVSYEKLIRTVISIDFPDNYICALRFDNKERLIIGTNFGLAVIETKEVGQIIAGKDLKEFETYNQFTGYPIRDVNAGTNNGAMHVDSDGILWVGHGSNGVARVDLDAINKNNDAPNVVINKVSLKGEDVCYYSLKLEVKSLKLDSSVLGQQEVATYGKVLSQAERDTLQQRFEGITFDGITKFYPLPENLVLPYAHNALTFEFNAIETGRNFLVNYQFALVEGKHTPSPSQEGNLDWSPITKKSDATFNNLWEGEYTFLLKAQSPWGIWSEPIEFKFTVLPPWYRTWWAYLGYAIIGLLVIWGLIQMQTKKLKEEQKVLEQKVEEATSELRVQSDELKVKNDELGNKNAEIESVLVEVEAKNVEIEKQKEEVEKQKEHIEEAHKEITDSIDYAERIQFSFLATKAMLDENLGEHFVFFRPKDVVSGDFYLAGTLSNGNFAIVNADSTGHGVPGAIMSILNITAIEKAVDVGITSPAEIFNSARTTIIERLKKDGSEHGGKDGMDASIVCFNADKTKMTYTAAQNPIWVIRDGEVIQIKAEKMPVGKHDNDHVPFVGGEFDLQKGDIVYTLTDGFQDQFGGPKGKKFMIKKMREYVLSISHLPMQEQYQKLDEVFSNWRGDQEQVDDVCIIGVRV
ncbi:MAG: serine phosphatase RsbU (regulator of sigma subunit), partial [Parvicellaceae bacterium]